MHKVSLCTIRNCCWSQACCAVQIPLVGISDELEADMLQCLEQRAALSPTALPSAAFYTFVNSHHTLNCVTTSSDAACVAGQPSVHHAAYGSQYFSRLLTGCYALVSNRCRPPCSCCQACSPHMPLLLSPSHECTKQHNAEVAAVSTFATSHPQTETSAVMVIAFTQLTPSPWVMYVQS